MAEATGGSSACLTRRPRRTDDQRVDLMTPYIAELGEVIDMEAIRKANLRIGVDPLGGAAVAYWQPIAKHYGLNIEVVNPTVDPAFGFMTLDHDGKIRMDCSSPYAMASLVGLKDKFDIAWGNDADVDRHGIVTPSVGLMNPNHYLAVAINYLLAHRPQWPASAAVGKTLVSSGLIDRVVNGLGRKFLEVPVGFKWFSPGLLDGGFCFGGEESAGASFLRRDGSAWTTDKDGIILGLLAAEITAVTGKDPGRHYQDLAAKYGTPVLHPHRRAGQPGAEGRLQAAHRRARHRRHAGRRADHRTPDARARQRRADRRPQGDDGKRLVRRPPLGHRGHLQALRRELQERGAPASRSSPRRRRSSRPRWPESRHWWDGG